MLITAYCEYCKTLIERKVSPNHVPKKFFCDTKHRAKYQRKVTFVEEPVKEPEDRGSYLEILAKSKGMTVQEAGEWYKKYKERQKFNFVWKL